MEVSPKTNFILPWAHVLPVDIPQIMWFMVTDYQSISTKTGVME